MSEKENEEKEKEKRSIRQKKALVEEKERQTIAHNVTHGETAKTTLWNWLYLHFCKINITMNNKLPDY